MTEGPFKVRYRNHKHDFKNESKRSATCLSEHIWALKDRQIEFSIKWRFLKLLRSYSPTSGKCDLCLGEKHFIIFNPKGATINKRSEIATTCRHKAKFLLSNC